jgi:PPK2 family polyphosphate:nucleotide phosphotransferase
MQRYLVKPGSKVRLARRDAGDTSEWKGSKKEAAARLAELNGRLDALQDQLYAGHRHRLLVVLQGMDTSGKDGTIRHVFEGVDPLGVRVASFKAPTAEELDHDFLWRIHSRVPGRGEIALFNRSHYEDVVTVRVKGLAPEEVWRERYRHIVHFEELLSGEGTTVLKFFLHIDRDEQKERLEARLSDRHKRWKFRLGDLEARRQWDEYMAAYEEAIEQTSRKHAPWYVVPANKKWYRNLVVATVLVKTLEGLGMSWPEPEEDLSGIAVE